MLPVAACGMAPYRLVVSDELGSWVEYEEIPTLNLDYLECAVAGHSEGAIWSLPEQYAWINDRLAGTPLDADACTRKPAVCCSAAPADKCPR